MKRLFLTILIMASCFVLGGCQREILGGQPSAEGEGVVVLNLGINTADAAAKSLLKALGNSLGDSERAIKSLRVFAFNGNGDFDKSKLVGFSPATTATILEKIEVAKDSDKRLYFVANEPAELTEQLENITTEQQLLDLNFAIAAAMNGGFNGDDAFEVSDFLIPMSGKLSLDATRDCNVSVALDRAVARVDLYLDKNSAAAGKEVKLTDQTTFSVSGVNLNSYLFKQNVVGDAAQTSSFVKNSSEVVLDVKNSDRSSGERVLTFYVAEQNYDIDDPAKSIVISINKLMVEGEYKNITNTITLGDPVVSSEIDQINRNWCYRIFATYVGVKNEVVADDYVVVDWQYKEIDGEIEGVMVALDNVVAADWLNNGNSFTCKEAFFGSNKPISILLPVEDGTVDEDGIAGYKFVEYDFDKIAGNSYELTTLNLEKSYIHKTSWIESAKLVFTSPQTGYIEYTYKPVSIHYKMQTYPVRIKSDNVLKQMTLVYDNSHIPYSYLPPHWKLRAPNGIVLAKRGYAKLPTKVDEIFYRDKDGYYRGEYETTALLADQYCKQMLGEKWYVPSKEDMEAILKGANELGTSYRFQNSGSDFGLPQTPSLYWTTTSDDGGANYWCGNLELKDKFVTDPEPWLSQNPANELHFVRCVLDL